MVLGRCGLGIDGPEALLQLTLTFLAAPFGWRFPRPHAEGLDVGGFDLLAVHVLVVW